MISQAQTDFDRIAEAIDFIKINFLVQPSLEEIAKHVNVSPSHFQKMFTDWAGVSPKQFLQYITINYAKQKLRKENATLFSTAIDSGLSSTSRLHDMFIKIESMTPAEYKNGGENLFIKYTFAKSVFGNLIIANTTKGICYLAFCDEEILALKLLKTYFPNANFALENNIQQEEILKVFSNEFKSIKDIKLHVKGTTFQLKIWETLLTIPYGELSTYGAVATIAGNPKAARAAGTAIGDNPVAYLIPCHRVIQATGIFGGYMWGPKRKTAILGWEGAQVEKQQ